jgi:hypothetical protein
MYTLLYIRNCCGTYQPCIHFFYHCNTPDLASIYTCSNVINAQEMAVKLELHYG